ncbi:MAG: hypothetical protein K8H74_12805 [Notoacmeibacter sp.]|nr:hypothetical protein [Notoacmeibacter sp.]
MKLIMKAALRREPATRRRFLNASSQAEMRFFHDFKELGGARTLRQSAARFGFAPPGKHIIL